MLVVLDLDPDVKQEVIYLKKSLFAQIGIQEYSAESKWKNPAATFVLPDVYCIERQECFDVDLCANPPEDEESPLVSVYAWSSVSINEIACFLTFWVTYFHRHRNNGFAAGAAVLTISIK